MLTREHLRYSIKEGAIHPHLIVESGSWPKRLQAHLELLELGLPMSLSDLQDLGRGLVAKHPNSRKLVLGLMSILEKHLEVDEVNEDDFMARRELLFNKSVENLRATPKIPPLPRAPDNFVAYGDLESERRIRSLGMPKGLEWVRRYNLELVQGLVRQGERVRLHWLALSAQRWKFLCRQLRFWGLLFHIDASDQREGRSLVIEGPLSRLGGHQTYMNRIAALVGILPQMPPFSLKADLVLDGRRYHLDIDDCLNLRSPHRSFFDHEPEAWSLLRQSLMEELEDGWTWNDDLVPSGGWEGWLVPDAILTAPSGQEIAVHHFQAHQTEAMERVLNLLKERGHGEKRLWLVERPLEKAWKGPDHDLVYPYRSLPSGKRLAGLLKSL